MRRAATLVVVALALGALAPWSAAAQAAPTRAAVQTAAAQTAATQASPGASALKQATGYAPSQLQARPVCGAAQPGQIRCLAQLLTVKSSGRPASPLRTPRASSAAASATAAPAEYTAGFLQWAYDTTWLSANEGAGDTVAIVDAYGDPSAYSDMEQFRSANGLPAISTCGGSITSGCFEVVNQNGQTSPLPGNRDDETGSWNIEESLDIDAVSSICPLCKIIVVETKTDDSDDLPDLETGVSTAAALGANQISLSWGADTYPQATSYASPYDSITSAAILAAAGDGSYPGPYVGYPAALADVTAVGGTSLASSSSAARGFTETAWAMQTCADGSTCGTESGCDTSQSKPAYQDGVTTDCTGRAYNDISADADPNTGLEIYDSQPGSEGCDTSNNWCIVGGTSLATPLTAAFEAITGVAGTTPAWAYSDTYAPLLNDITSGSDGTCPSDQTVICTAGTDWDGPTGNGSINGDVVSGGPGIGLQPNATGVGSTSADVSATVDPNDASAEANTISYWWQYGLTTAYGTNTSPVYLSAGTGFQNASATLSSLTQPCTYHFRIVASNGVGTVYGYDHTVTTTQTTAAPVNTEPPTISGTTAIGQQLTAQPGTWSGVDCDDVTYQWQESSSPNGPWTAISGATSATYTLTTSDANEYLEVVVTDTNNGGSVPAVSQPTAQVPAPPSTTTTTTSPTTTIPTSTSPTQQAPTSPASTETVRFYRCARTCVLINTHGATTYKPGKADYGRYIKIVTTVTRTAGAIRTAQVSTRWVGPITSSTAGVVSIGTGVHVAATLGVRTSTHRLLAQVRIARRASARLTLVITREGRTSTRVWAYVVRKGAVLSCTAAHTLGAKLTLSVALKAGQTVKLVALRT